MGLNLQIPRFIKVVCMVLCVDNERKNVRGDEEVCTAFY